MKKEHNNVGFDANQPFQTRPVGDVNGDPAAESTELIPGMGDNNGAMFCLGLINIGCVIAVVIMNTMYSCTSNWFVFNSGGNVLTGGWIVVAGIGVLISCTCNACLHATIFALFGVAVTGLISLLVSGICASLGCGYCNIGSSSSSDYCDCPADLQIGIIAVSFSSFVLTPMMFFCIGFYNKIKNGETQHLVT